MESLRKKKGILGTVLAALIGLLAATTVATTTTASALRRIGGALLNLQIMQVRNAEVWPAPDQDRPE